jgi:hypothetical protein
LREQSLSASARFARPIPAEHAREDAAVERVERVPLREPHGPVGVEDRRLPHPGALLSPDDLELQPQPTEDRHLGAQPQQAARLEALEREKSTVSPSFRSYGSRRPRRSPTPPLAVSSTHA